MIIKLMRSADIGHAIGGNLPDKSYGKSTKFPINLNRTLLTTQALFNRYKVWPSEEVTMDKGHI